MILKNIINEELNILIKEVRYIDTDSTNKKNWKDAYYHDPIKNNETIRVFHGCDNLSDALIFAKYGVSGKKWHPRKYSYESGMNPSGLFVTTSFKVASDKFAYGNLARVVIEFTARVSDLDTPVWNNSDSYFGQGSNPQPFRNKEEREVQKQKYNDDASNSDETRITQSDNKALAQMIFNNSEHQALFSGDLNPNMIKRFWVSAKDNNYQWVKLDLKQFLKQYGENEISDNVDSAHNYPEFKMYKPNDNFDGFDELAVKLANWYRGKRKEVTDEDIEYYKKVVDDLFNSDNDYDTIKQIMYPKQIIQAKGEDWFRDHFNKFY